MSSDAWSNGAGLKTVNWRLIARFSKEFLSHSPSQAVRVLTWVVVGAAVESFALFLIAPLLIVAEHVSIGRGGTPPLPVWWPGLAGTGPQALAGLLTLVALALFLRPLIVNRRQEAVVRLDLGYLLARQRAVIDAMASAPWAMLVRLRHSRVTHLLTNDVHKLGQAAMGLLLSVSAVVTLAVQTVIITLLSPWLSIFILVMAISTLALSHSLLRTAQATGEQVSHANLAALNSTSQFLSAMKSAIIENAQTQLVKDFTAGREEVIAAELLYTRRQGRSRLLIGLGGMIVAMVICVAGFYALALAPSTIVAILAVLSRMAGPAGQLQTQLQGLVRAMPAYGHIILLERDLSTGESSLPSIDMSTPEAAFKTIEFCRVGYRHGAVSSAAAAGLSDVSITIEAGEFIGIAGPSGAGKTTFADLLVGLVDPEAGVVRIDGLPISLRSTSWWREGLAYIAQDPFLRNESVRLNLRSAAPDADDDELLAALALAGAESLIRQLPDGLDTVLGERGTLISGGERQRIAMARALLRKPLLLVLDEATNALDQPAENLVLSRLAEQRADRTTILITHRLATLRHCDRVAIFDAGRLRLITDPREAIRLLREDRLAGGATEPMNFEDL